MVWYNQNGWLDAAMDQVRCRPERKAIRAELLGHLEDKEQFFRDSGMEAQEAARSAVEAMGDPVEVGKALDKAHPFIWGYVYTAAKVVAVLLCVAAAFMGIDYVRTVGYWNLLDSYPLKMEIYDPALWGGDGVIILEDTYEPVRRSGYTVDVTRAYWDPVVEYTTAAGEQQDENVLCVDFKICNPRPWAVTPLFFGRLEVRGDEDTAFEIRANMATGDAYVGDIFHVEYNILDEYRYWGAWYFTVYINGVEYGDTVTLSIPGQDAMTWSVSVEVAQ